MPPGRTAAAKGAASAATAASAAASATLQQSLVVQPSLSATRSDPSSSTGQKHVKVVVRTRPTSNFAHEFISFDPNQKGSDGGYINNQQENWDFRFDNLLHNASQEKVYDECGAHVVKSLLEGYHGTILAYGQTGAGKTFTMTGATENYKHRGLIPRAISHLFREIGERPHLACTIRVSYLEIYNEQIIDLLGDPSSDTARSFADSSNGGLIVVEDKAGAPHVKGLNVQIANSEEEALNLLFEGETNRSIAEHQMNKSSTRSHCIFTMYLESRSRVESSEKVISSKLNLVDLAGSERLAKTQTQGVSMKEAMYINKSLTFLEQVIIALADKRRDHIPYRQSKLTHVLRDSLGGNCNTLMIANVWGERAHIEETISTLRFATRMMCVSNTPVVNVQFDPIALIKKYERDITDLKQELAMHDALASRSHVPYEPFSDSQRQDLQKIVRAFLRDEEQEIEVLRHLQDSDHDDYVGETETGGFSVGLAPPGSKPSKSTAVAQPLKKKTTTKPLAPSPTGIRPGVQAPYVKGEDDGMERQHDEGYVGLPPLPTAASAAQRGDRSPVPGGHPLASGGPGYGGMVVTTASTRAEEFEKFKRAQGAEMLKILTENKASLKEKRKVAKNLVDEINEAKSTIDKLKSDIDARRRGQSFKGSDDIVIDEEEYAGLERLRTLKQTYRDLVDRLRQARLDVSYCARLVDQCRQKLVLDFDQWYEATYGRLPADLDAVDAQSEDLMDIGERFERLQFERMSQEDPDSLPYYNARKNTTRRQLRA
ncbi:Kinesin-like protein kif9, partial [Cladochytrium tenue]